MLMTSLYAVTVPAFIRALKNLDHCLGKAAASGIDEQALTGARMVEDMLPLTKQVQIASDTARGCAVRVGQAEAQPMADEETTIAELRERVAKTIAYLEAVDPAGFEGRETAEVILKLPNGDLPFTGLSFVTDFAVPNFYFHVTTAYDLLRAKGVQIGKMDFLAGAFLPA
jgi:uncharacterized protein